MERIEFHELDPTGVSLELNSEEARALVAVGDRVSVEWLGPARARVRSGGYVGSVRLSKQRTLAVTTKVPIANVLGLASLAYRSVPLPHSVGVTDLSQDRPVEWLAFLAILEIEALLARGMRQGYVELDDDLPYVRGRIRFETVTATRARPALVACTFSDFQPDTPENQVLRSTLELLRTIRLPHRLHERADEALRYLAQVRLVPASMHLWTRVRISRLNQHYAPALELCRLVLEQVGVELGEGGVEARAFFFPMAAVFEAAVANYVRLRVRNVKTKPRRSLAPRLGTPTVAFSYEPDLVIGEPTRLVVDTKYARAMVKGKHGPTWNNGNAYQIVFYGLGFGCPGVLVYPKDEAAGDVEATFDVAGREFTILTVDLQRPGLAGLDRLCGWVTRRLEPGVPR